MIIFILEFSKDLNLVNNFRIRCCEIFKERVLLIHWLSVPDKKFPTVRN